MAEHTHTRTAAGLFDVSHMGQLRLDGPDAVAALERLVPGDIAGLAPWAMRYTQFTNDGGGILDDLIVTRTDDGLLLVVNASCKEQDIAHVERRLDAGVSLDRARRARARRAAGAGGRQRCSTATRRVAPGLRS